MQMPHLSWAQTSLGHMFANTGLLDAALTHSSSAGTTYERLEFLGDRVLGLVIADWLFETYPDEGEGKLARRLSELVRRETCAAVARSIGVMPYVRVERSARAARVHEGETLLGDVCEALIGALYKDGGLRSAQQFIKTHWAPFILATPMVPKDPKSLLQEWAQGKGLPIPVYTVIEQTGPGHAPVFTVEVSVFGLKTHTAQAASKQEAQKRAAAALLAHIEQDML